MKDIISFLLFTLALYYCGVYCWAKECTNSPSQDPPDFHKILLATDNQTVQDVVFSQYTAGIGGSYSSSAAAPEGHGLKILKEVSLHDVRLEPDSLHGRGQQTNLEYLLMLDPDNLVWSFRKTANLPTTGDPYEGWENKSSELRGHFVGHYMSASAMMWASTHNDTLKQKMTAVVSALSACQKKMNTGYLSAFPSEEFDRIEAIKYVWAPYYTIHKIMAGLMDQYRFGNNGEALKMATWMADYFYNRVKRVVVQHTLENHYEMLNNECGGMNDVLYRMYNITRNQKHFVLAQLFDKPCFLGRLAIKAPDISELHANTHIPLVAGTQMRYELTGDPVSKEIAKFFMYLVNSSYTYATGGTSSNEWWNEPYRLGSTLRPETEESCTTYNMLKVSRNLFMWSKEMSHADYYERALTNGVLSIQRRSQPGIMTYFLPLTSGGSKARSYRAWGTPYSSFWCCYGTGIESFSKLGDSIYFEEEGKELGLYVNQYISSSLDWKSAQVLLKQKVDPVVSHDPYLRVNFTFSAVKGAGNPFRLNLRIPKWSSLEGAVAKQNNQNLHVQPPGTFQSVSVKPGDGLSLQLPLNLMTEAIQDNRPEFGSVKAIFYGPYLLAGLTASSNFSEINIGSDSSPSSWITPIPAADYNAHLVTLSQGHGNSTFVFTNSNKSITMETGPELGTEEAAHATFRLILADDSNNSTTGFSATNDAIGKEVMMEPYDLPGMVVVAQGLDGTLGISSSSSRNHSSVFRVSPGLNGKQGTISLESKIQKGCYVHSGVNYNPGIQLRLVCSATFDSFKEGASFAIGGGMTQYDPISFIAKGAQRDYLMLPLLSLADESYSVYFNFTSGK